jgi:hypothetical protein
MTPEERSLLERTYKLSEDNNQILHSIRRSNRLAAVARVFYWIVIIVVSFGAYYFIQPYFNMLTGMLDKIGGAHGFQSLLDLMPTASSTPGF